MSSDEFQASNDHADPADSGLRRPWWQRLLRSPTVWIFVGFVILGIMIIDWMDEIGGPSAFREKFGALAPLVTVVAHVVVAVTPFPSDAMAMANGVLYGFWVGVCLTWLGWALAGVAEFALGRRARHDFSLDAALAKAPAWISHFPVSHPVYLLASRQIPWLGGHISTFVPGAAGVSWRRFLWCSAIAIIPSSILMTGIGAGIARAQLSFN
jgi:uncharacterized membrane protein YdjX (TVP38/TMEM64 family)